MFFSSILLFCLPTVILGLVQPDGIPFKFPTAVAPGINASVVFSNLTNPRGITFDSQQNLLVVEHGVGVSAFTRVRSPIAGWNRTLVIASDAFTHGIQVEGTTLYVSTASEVLAYRYDPTTRTASVAPSTLITGLPADGELITHTLQLEHNGSGVLVALLVGSGPQTNIDITARDPASGRSQIRRFVLNIAASFPIPWSTGEIIAFGIRNPAGFTFPSINTANPVNLRTLLVVENAASIDNVTGITPAFANDNPADEIETVSYSSASPTSRPPSYGFPDCTTLWNPRADPVGVPQYMGLPRGAQFSLNLPVTTNELRDDAWCRNLTNNIPPSFSFQAHSVPLDIKQYQPKIGQANAGIPVAMAGDVFVSFHGSFDRSPPTGYGVVHVPFPFNTTSADSAGHSFLIQAADLTPCPAKCLRPVGLAFGNDNRLYASSDSTGEVFVLQSSVS